MIQSVSSLRGFWFKSQPGFEYLNVSFQRFDERKASSSGEEVWLTGCSLCRHWNECFILTCYDVLQVSNMAEAPRLSGNKASEEKITSVWNMRLIELQGKWAPDSKPDPSDTLSCDPDAQKPCGWVSEKTFGFTEDVNSYFVFNEWMNEFNEWGDSCMQQVQNSTNIRIMYSCSKP